MNQLRPVGDQLRDWRQRRRLSQMDLALDADISTRHLSFVETGRSTPSRDLLLHLADQLGVPLRERNALLLSAGYAPAYAERPLDDPALAAARAAVDLLLKAHEPFPALAVDRHWNLVAANGAVGPFLDGVSPDLLGPPLNVLRLSLHPQGLAPRIANFGEWRTHILDRLRQQIATTADDRLIDLHAELSGYPGGEEGGGHTDYGGVVVPMRLRTPAGELNFFSTITVFGTPVDVTLAELAIEAFFPADEATASALRAV
ncbi:helix-turn-helix domain-containing protein [Sphingoaurantiacus capsulatus]|uniref:Helix-turn-helix domain-containing protein n=1 Tax=Sphingoaurantiacus capsulatus TaxID=1771310 RepID=A0ABV7X833_9SPHN